MPSNNYFQVKKCTYVYYKKCVTIEESLLLLSTFCNFKQNIFLKDIYIYKQKLKLLSWCNKLVRNVNHSLLKSMFLTKAFRVHFHFLTYFPKKYFFFKLQFCSLVWFINRCLFFFKNSYFITAQWYIIFNPQLLNRDFYGR